MHEEDRDIDCPDCLGPLAWTGEKWARLDDGFIWECAECCTDRVVPFA